MSNKYNLTDPKVKEQAERAEQGFPLLPKGSYLMRVSEASYRRVASSEKNPDGFDALDLQLAVVPGEPHEHSMTRDSLSFTEKGLGRVLLVLSALGLTDADLAVIDPQDTNLHRKLVGRLAIVEVDHRPDKNGKVWANPTYAGYKVSTPSSLEEMRRMRGAADGTPASKPGEVDYGKVPF